VRKALDYAEKLGVTHAILTGKAEPTQESYDYIWRLIQLCRERGLLVDLHTNGYKLQRNVGGDYTLELLSEWGLTMVTFSIFHFDDEIHKEITGLSVNFEKLIREANSLGLLVRVSLVLAKSGIGTVDTLLEFIHRMGNMGVHMMTVRQLWIPTVRPGRFNEEVYRWNKENFVPMYQISDAFAQHASSGEISLAWQKYPIYTLAPLPWGAQVFGMEGCFDDPEHGVNITFSHCEENDKGPVMKSIVHKPNGHGYRNWDFNANILY
jgi:molybdenum cofactor biosynthesis enzyme MoaA